MGAPLSSEKLAVVTVAVMLLTSESDGRQLSSSESELAWRLSGRRWGGQRRAQTRPSRRAP